MTSTSLDSAEYTTWLFHWTVLPSLTMQEG